MHQLIHQNDTFDAANTESENISNTSKSSEELTSQIKQAEVEEKTIQHDDGILHNTSQSFSSE